MASLKSATTLAILALTIIHVGYANYGDNEWQIWTTALESAGISTENLSSRTKLEQMSDIFKKPGFLRYIDKELIQDVFEVNIETADQVMAAIEKVIERNKTQHSDVFEMLAREHAATSESFHWNDLLRSAVSK